MHLTTLLSLLATTLLATTTHAIPLQPLAPGSDDGFYGATIDANGNTHWEFLVPPPSSPSTPALTKRADGVNCAGPFVQDWDLAVSSFLELCGSGLPWSARAISFQVGDAVAYGCNYAGAQTCRSQDVSPLFQAVKDGCGTAEGFFSDPGSSTGWGVTTVGVSYC